MNQEVVSFVLRFIREEDNGQPARWRGVIKHVQSDHAADFSHFSDALLFMQTHVDEAIRQAFSANDAETPTPESLFAETTRLWGELAPRYTDIMLQSMEIFLEQGRRMGESFAESMARWGQTAGQTPPQTNQTQSQMLDVIERLTTQISQLSTKVDHLEEQLRNDRPTE